MKEIRNTYESFSIWATSLGWLLINKGERFAYWVSPSGSVIIVAYDSNGNLDYAQLGNQTGD